MMEAPEECSKIEIFEDDTRKDLLYREDILKNILKTVKNNRDLHVNGADFDLLL